MTTLVTHLPQTLPHLHTLTEELLITLLRKIGQTGKLTSPLLTTYLNSSSFISEISLLTCGNVVDDHWLESIVQNRQNENILKLDLMNCNKVTDRGMLTLGKLKNLRVVVVDGNSQVTCEGAEVLERALPHVTVLRVVAMCGELTYLEFTKPSPRSSRLCL